MFNSEQLSLALNTTYIDVQRINIYSSPSYLLSVDCLGRNGVIYIHAYTQWSREMYVH